MVSLDFMARSIHLVSFLFFDKKNYAFKQDNCKSARINLFISIYMGFGKSYRLELAYEGSSLYRLLAHLKCKEV
jgi:hypothetical protein